MKRIILVFFAVLFLSIIGKTAAQVQVTTSEFTTISPVVVNQQDKDVSVINASVDDSTDTESNKISDELIIGVILVVVGVSILALMFIFGERFAESGMWWVVGVATILFIILASVGTCLIIEFGNNLP